MCKVYRYLNLLDKSKQTVPKLSTVLEPLANFLQESVPLNRLDSGDRLSSCQTSDLSSLKQAMRDLGEGSSERAAPLRKIETENSLN